MSIPGCKPPHRIPYGLVIGPETGQISPDEDGDDEVDADGAELIALATAALAWRRAFASAIHSFSLRAHRKEEVTAVHGANARSSKAERPKTDRKPVGGSRRQAVCGRVKSAREAACDYTKWPEVKALPAVAVESSTRQLRRRHGED
jgi:hypothetical protein